MPCADDGKRREELHCTSWRAEGATGTGTMTFNDCMADCADGHFHAVPGARLTLTIPIRGAGGPRVWSEIQLSPLPRGDAKCTGNRPPTLAKVRVNPSALTPGSDGRLGK